MNSPSRNVDPATVAGFGTEWRTFDQKALTDKELTQAFEEFFRIFPWERIAPDAVGFDAGCGSGRWAQLVAPRVGMLHCVDASPEALDVARRNLGKHRNCTFHEASLSDLPFAPRSLDFGYALGVLHHVPDTEAALRACVEVLRPGAPFLLYVYYALDGRPWWYRTLWRISDCFRRVVARLPHPAKLAISTSIALAVYWPAARSARLAEHAGLRPHNIPLAYYRRRSLYTMRTDAYDRLGTRLEKRFRAEEVRSLMQRAGLGNIELSPDPPFWCATGWRE